MEKEEIKKYVIAILLLLLVYLSYLIIKPFITSLLTAFVLAYLFFPLYKKFRAFTKSNFFSSLITTVIIILIILLPLSLVATSLIKESKTIINSPKIQETEELIANYLAEDQKIKDSVASISENAVEFIKKEAQSLIFAIPSKILSLLITIFALFYSFMIGERLLKTIKQTLPVKRKEQLIDHIAKTTNAIMYGLFATALIEFIIAVIGFRLLGVSAPFTLALIVGILTLIPFIGPIIIWLPLTIIKIIETNYPKAIGLFILGSILSISENLIRIKIIGKRAKLHPIVVLLGIIGGINVLGFIGMVVGPIILSTLIVIINEYYPLKNHET